MKNILEEKLSGVKENVLLKDCTTFKIGGPARYFFVAKSDEDLIKAAEIAKKLKLPIFILAGGSKILVSDEGFKGLVVQVKTSQFKIQNSNKIYADAGVAFSRLLNFVMQNGFTGFEWTAGIPCITVGGAIYGRAQAFGNSSDDFLESVRVLDLKTLKIKNFSKKQCRFSLKNSVFKKNKNLVILSAIFKLKTVDKSQIQENIRNNLKYRRENHPMNLPSAGSTFVNPEVIVKNKKLLEKFPELEIFNKKKVIPAGYLVAKSGLSGLKSGGAQISDKHSNFIVNLGDARAEDVLKLINLAKKKVKKIFGINLETEVQFVGFDKKVI